MFLNMRFLFLVTTRHMAGHSKWANIKHIKGAKDAERASLHQKLFRQFKAVIREQGSSDPKVNQKLAHLIEQARHHNVPSEKIQQALKNSDQTKEDLKNYIFEVRGPGGSFFVCEVLTSSHARAKQSVNTINRKFNASWADGVSNSLFSHKGVIKTSPLTNNQTLEEALDHAIDAGAEDVSIDSSGNFTFITSPQDFFTVNKNLKSFGYVLVESDLCFLPLQKVALSEDDLTTASKLHDKLEEEPDIYRIHDNIE